MAAALDRILLLPPIVAGSHYDGDQLGEFVTWFVYQSPVNTDGSYKARSLYIDYSPLVKEIHAKTVDLIPFIQARSLELPVVSSRLQCHNVAGKASTSFVYNAKRDAFVCRFNLSLEFLSGYDNILLSSPPNQVTFEQHASYLAQADARLPVACTSSLFTGLTRLPHVTQEASLVHLRPWLQAAAQLFVRTSADGIIGSWVDRLGQFLNITISDSDVPNMITEVECAPAVPFLGVHWRRGDFVHFCQDKEPRCYPTLEASLGLIRSIRQEYLTDSTSLVIIATNTESWDDVIEFQASNFTVINHSELRTVDYFGTFAPVWLDLAMFVQCVTQFLNIQAISSLENTNNVAFIGNAYSTMSLWLQERRAARGKRSSIYFE